MESKRFKPMTDRAFRLTAITVTAALAIGTALASHAPIALLILIAADLFTLYFLVTPLFGYVELREDGIYIKFGLLTKKEIPYESIRDAVKERKIYADSMISLKSSLEHVNIKYDRFDVVSVSVVNNDELIAELQERIADSK